MMGTFGFSHVGAVFLLCLLAPNLLWRRCRPRDYDPAGEPRLLPVLERIGQVWVTCGALMVLYELWWLRYFRRSRTMADFTSSLLGVPAAGAALPAAFFLLAVYRRSALLAAGVVILGAGHIGIHLFHRRKLGKETDI